jgi:hypothetical protein
MEVATRRALHRLVLTAASGRRRPPALSLLPLTHGIPLSPWPASRPGIQRLTRGRHRAERAVGGVRRCGPTRVSTAGAIFWGHAFQLWWGAWRCSRMFTWVHGRPAAGVGTVTGLAKRRGVVRRPAVQLLHGGVSTGRCESTVLPDAPHGPGVGGTSMSYPTSMLPR